jgi:protein-S-isoprenylcysteine O-methyltransferase Ste14
MERGLDAGALAPATQQLLLVAAGVALALAVGLGCEVVLSWVLGPSWASSLGLIAVLAGLFWSVAGRDDDPPA